ncbi:uncharacterized protein LOC105426884 [Pogonomyrmex barbatus]|uniref:Uncharacterized protein LOC105426884 n=1 Tax=Pogonomyrmex barbatus TaxID=144034 RepID=A0A6I9WCC2_9HYME|nr:uncharacterized protein LOC105426884 [Pogonomyrmex barbatus]XP_011636607.1 uncharacterized protein LOC105426884 [Pogonomyrmex barbatus]XP_011636615.1 uncharacterized protein LOC105426884 [Pogonomyrmex barbatus]XP_011636624.1 uncharacterized protein LOC105426884 [Pogonomyrmex barbatus]
MEDLSSCKRDNTYDFCLTGSKSILTDLTHPRFMLSRLDSFRAVCSGHCSQTMPNPFLAILIGPTLTLRGTVTKRGNLSTDLLSCHSIVKAEVILSCPAIVASEWEVPTQSSTMKNSPTKRRNQEE